MSDPILRISDLRLSRGKRPILVGVSLAIERGSFVALMGPSGSGKTTVLHVVAGLERFDGGQVAIDGVTLQGGASIPQPTLRNLRKKVGMVFQFHCLFEHISALANVCLAPVHAHRVAPADAERRGRELLQSFGVQHRANAMPRELSGGEAQRVAIARALAVDPPVLLMDEPTASLDPQRRSELAELLRGLLQQGRTLVVATHDEEFAREAATRIVRMQDGLITQV